MTSTTLAIVIVVGAGVWLGLLALLHATQDKREPPPLDTTIPFVGPIIGYAKHSVKYLMKLQEEHRLPICTLRMPFSRIYIVNQPSLIRAVLRLSDAVSFGSVGRDFGFLFSGLTEKSKDTLRRAYSNDGNGFTRIVHQYLKEGPFLRNASRSAVEGLASAVSKWGYHGVPLNLFDTVRHALTIALTDTVWGPQNPFRSAEVEAAWLEFVPGISHLIYSPLASLTARRSLQARGKVIAAFLRYFETGGHLQGSQMIQDMYEVNKGHGLSTEECAKMEIATSLAILSSGSLTAFWFILHILSDAAILKSVREEIVTNLTSMKNDHEKSILMVDLSKTKTNCPILMSVFQETMRYHSTVMSAKMVQHDLILADTYFLKGGSLLMIPGPVVHHDRSIWGPNTSIFDHRRFLDTKKKNIGSSSYRPFGSGVSMCPGRHFSTNAILGLTAMMVLQFDVSPFDFEGKWILPTTEGADLWNAMPAPDNDVTVEIVPREMKGVEYQFVWNDAEGDNGDGGHN